jgi:predicted dehydrogenase
MMPNRREIMGGAAAALFSKTVLGANDRINFAFIGLGGRTNLLDAAFRKQPDGNLAVICDVNRAKLETYQNNKLADIKVESYADYRRILDRKDIDALLIATPDHSHAPIMIAALEAGKDVYVEKLCSNTIGAAVSMLKAYRSHKQVVQLGTQQRSWDHFREAAKLIWDGYIGTVNHVVVGLAGGGGGAARTVQANPAQQPVPEGLDWDAWLGPAKRVPYDPRRYGGWRGYFDYGGGAITDWGVHWLDIVNLAMQTDIGAPSFTSAVSAYPGDENPDLERVPGAWMIEYKYPKYLMSMLSFTPPTTEPIAEGPTFLGTKAWLRVSRSGFIVRMNRGSGPSRAGGPSAARGGQAPQSVAGAATATGGGGVAQQQQPPIEERSYLLTGEQNVAHERASEGVHVRNFFDCIKSRQKPTAEFEIGFHSTLPCLLGRQAVKEGRALVWDETQLTAKPVAG